MPSVDDARFWKACEDKYFREPYAEFRHAPRDPHDLHAPLPAKGVIQHYMAGYRRPTTERVKRLLLVDTSDITDEERSFFHELFAQMTPLECREFMMSTCSTPREMASLMRTCEVHRAVVVNWINQYANDSDWRTDNILAIVYADRLTKHRDQIVPRDSIRPKLQKGC